MQVRPREIRGDQGCGVLLAHLQVTPKISRNMSLSLAARDSACQCVTHDSAPASSRTQVLEVWWLRDWQVLGRATGPPGHLRSHAMVPAGETELFASQHSTACCSMALRAYFLAAEKPEHPRLRMVVPNDVLTSTLEMFWSHLHLCPVESGRMMMLLKTHRRILKAFRTKFKEFQRLVYKKDRIHFFALANNLV
jgi:hypothetical protein